MLGRKCENVRPVSLADVKDILGSRASQPDFGYEQQMSLDYAKKFCKLTLEDAKAMVEELAKYESLKPETTMKIVDILPEHKATLLAIGAKDKSTPTDSEYDEIAKIISKYRERIIEAPKEEPKVEGDAAPVEPADEKKEEKAEEKKEAKEKPEPKEKGEAKEKPEKKGRKKKEE